MSFPSAARIIRSRFASRFACSALAFIAIFACAQTLPAAIFLSSSPGTPLDGGLVSYKLSAFSTSGQIINTFENPTIVPYLGGAGLHQVWSPITGSSTPTREEQLSAGVLWSDTWLDYDSYFYFSPANSLSVGGDFTETNGMTGGASLPSAGFGPPITGFGSYEYSGVSAAKLFTVASGIPDTSVAFAQLVLKDREYVAVSLTVLDNEGQATVVDPPFIVGGCCTPPFQLEGLDLGTVYRGDLVSASLEIVPNYDRDLFDWTLEDFNGAGGIVNPTTGEFSWDSSGATLGSYTAVIRASHFELGSDTGLLTFNLIPEPASITMLGLAMVGAFGFIRRR